MNQEGQQNGNLTIKACKRGHGAPSRNMQIDKNQPLARLPFARNVPRAPIKCSNGQKQKGLASTLAPAPPINVGIDHFRGVPEAPRQLYPRNATLSGGAGDGDSDPWTPFFAEILDFCRYTRFSFSERSNLGHRAT